MPVTNFTTDIENRTITITAEFDAPVERLWAMYADPRQLEQVWGPPEFPATFVDHSLTVGSRSVYYMTSPDGEKFGGWWRITEVDEPNSFSFDDGFADDDLNDNSDLPVSHNLFRFSFEGGKTVLRSTTTYDSAEALQQVIDMGIEEGTTTAMSQIDTFLAA